MHSLVPVGIRFPGLGLVPLGINCLVLVWFHLGSIVWSWFGSVPVGITCAGLGLVPTMVTSVVHGIICCVCGLGIMEHVPEVPSTMDVA